MQSNSPNTTPSKPVAADEDAVPGFASNTAHNTLVAGRAPDATRLKSLANDAAGTVRDIAKEARAVAADQVDAATTWVGNTAKARPLRTFGIALAVGAIIGLLIGRH
jgi:ElaB/YqjD/DUF883 family membrane-anchored ribosome-binding protein